MSAEVPPYDSRQTADERQHVLNRAYQLADIGNWEYDMETGRLYWSDNTKRIHGVELDHVPDVESTIELFKEGEDRETFRQAAMNAIEREQPFDVELRIISGKGDERWIRAIGHPEYEKGRCVRFFGISQDITKRRVAEEELKKSEQQIREHQKEILENLKEKETLLSEIHHRVKNNLAVISGMMQLQAFEAQPEVRTKLLDGISRIQTMALIHEQLYQSTSFSTLNFSDNIETLVRNILKTMHQRDQISLELVCDPITLNINQAVPCSLIVNEVITNAIKHAFPEQRAGTIEIVLTSRAENLVRLEILDNGVGLPDGQKSISPQSLGMHLIEVLAKQIQGTAAYQNRSDHSGTRFSLQFPLSQSKGPSSNLLEDPNKP